MVGEHAVTFRMGQNIHQRTTPIFPWKGVKGGGATWRE